VRVFWVAPVDKLLTFTLPPLRLDRGIGQLLLIGGLALLGWVIAWFPLREATLLLGAASVALLTLIRPGLLIYLLIPIIPFSPLFSIPLGGFNVGLMEMVLAWGIVVWLLQSSSQAWTNRHPLQRNTIAHGTGRFVLIWPFLILLAGVTLSWLGTLSLAASLVETFKWIEMLALYLFVVSVLPARHLKWAVLTLLLTGMAQAALGLYQFVFKVGPPGFLLFDGGFLRAYGTFAQPNPYGGYLSLVLPLSFALLIWVLTDPDANLFEFGSRPKASPSDESESSWSGPGADKRSKPVRRFEWPNIANLILLGIPFGLLLLALFASQSRGAWLGFATAAAVTFIVYNKKTATIFALVMFAGVIIGLAGAFDARLLAGGGSLDVVAQRFVDAFAIVTTSDITTIEVNDANFATIERLAHWQAAREMWRDNPWFGVGFGNYAVVYPAYAVGRWLDPLGHAHNYLLNIGAETGLVGITAYLIFWIFTFVVLFLGVRRNRGFYRAVAAGGLGIMVHLHVHNLFDNLYVQGMYLHVAIMLALVSIIFNQHHLSPGSPTGSTNYK